MIFLKNSCIILTLVLALVNNLCAVTSVTLGRYQFKKVDGVWVYASGRHTGEVVKSTKYLNKLHQLSEQDLDTISWDENASGSESERSEGHDSLSDDQISKEMFNQLRKIYADDGSSDGPEESNAEQNEALNEVEESNDVSKKSLHKCHAMLYQDSDLVPQIKDFLLAKEQGVVFDKGLSQERISLIERVIALLSKYHDDRPLNAVYKTDDGVFCVFGAHDEDDDVEELLLPAQTSEPENNSIEIVTIELLDEEAEIKGDDSNETIEQQYVFFDAGTGKYSLFSSDSKELEQCNQLLTKNPEQIEQINIFLADKRNQLNFGDSNTDRVVYFQDLVNFLEKFHQKPLRSIIFRQGGGCVYEYGNRDSENEQQKTTQEPISGDAAQEQIPTNIENDNQITRKQSSIDAEQQRLQEMSDQGVAPEQEKIIQENELEKSVPDQNQIENNQNVEKENIGTPEKIVEETINDDIYTSNMSWPCACTIL